MSRETLERTRSALERQPFRHATANETFAAIRELDIALGDACPRCAPVYTVAKAKVTQ